MNILYYEEKVEVVDYCCNELCEDFCNFVVDEVVYFGMGVSEMYQWYYGEDQSEGQNDLIEDQ